MVQCIIYLHYFRAKRDEDHLLHSIRLLVFSTASILIQRLLGAGKHLLIKIYKTADEKDVYTCTLLCRFNVSEKFVHTITHMECVYIESCWVFTCIEAALLTSN